MSRYAGFAEVYDLFMDNIPYQEWGEYLIRLLKYYGIHDGLIAELGCGTGTITEILAGQGYDMIGIDLSEAMLSEAMEKKARSGNSILYLNQDMRSFELYGTVKGIISICDSLNYITEEEELIQVFRLVNNYLDPGGYFIFDMDNIYKYEQLLGCQTICENREEGSFIWENTYEPDKHMNYYELTVFIRQENDLYEKHEELHIQRGYEISKIRELIETAGLEYVTAYDAFTMNPPDKNSTKTYYVAKEKGK